MVKYYCNKDSFLFSWDQVARGFWSRYPNPYSSHVLTEDVIFRKVEGSKLYSTRLLTKTNRIPKWGERFMTVKDVRIVEESVVDCETKTITTYTRNIGLRSIMTLEERCVYRPNPESHGASTVVERQAWVASSLFGFTTAIQAFGMERFKQNLSKTKKGFVYVLENLFPNAQGTQIETKTILAGNTVSDRSDKLRETAKKATELAKSKAVPLMAAASGVSANRQ